MDPIDYFSERTLADSLTVPLLIRNMPLPLYMYTISDAGLSTFNENLFRGNSLAIASGDIHRTHNERLSRLNLLLNRGILAKPFDLYATFEALRKQATVKSIHTIFDRLSDINMLIRRLPWTIEEEHLNHVLSLYQDILDSKRHWTTLMNAGKQAHAKLCILADFTEHNNIQLNDMSMESCKAWLRSYITSLLPPAWTDIFVDFRLTPSALGGEHYVVHNRFLIFQPLLDSDPLPEILEMDVKVKAAVTLYIDSRKDRGFEYLFTDSIDTNG